MKFIDRILVASSCPNCGQPYAEVVYNKANNRIEPFFLYQTVCCQRIYCTACNPYSDEPNGLASMSGECYFCKSKNRISDIARLKVNGNNLLQLIYRDKRYSLPNKQLPQLETTVTY
ncbi:MAG: hypothetical protein PHG67_07265 [Bacteroidales bacterium]|jgi:hypothetical protein|nr:hypothetical protein [Bacteroidales bacterium]MDY0086507.1 hypothetical protein [Bacteroidales bacterium]HOI31706.1 hypothetical protein [Bacteroidales bacterium]